MVSGLTSMVVAFFANILYLAMILIHWRQSLNLRFKCFHSKFKWMNIKYVRFSRFEISRYFVKCIFLTMGSSHCEGLSPPYLELVDAYKKRFMPQNGQVAILKCSPIWIRMRKRFNTSKLKLKFIPKAWSGKLRMTMPPPPLFKGSSLKIEILTRLLFFLI